MRTRYVVIDAKKQEDDTEKDPDRSDIVYHGQVAGYGV
jgi:hypothetical protein